MTIENKVVVIAGASSGIGAATAKLLASKGAKLVLGRDARSVWRKLHPKLVAITLFIKQLM